MNIPTRFSRLQPADQWLIRHMQELAFGRLTIRVLAGAADREGGCRIIRTQKLLGGNSGPRPQAQQSDFDDGDATANGQSGSCAVAAFDSREQWRSVTDASRRDPTSDFPRTLPASRVADSANSGRPGRANDANDARFRFSIYFQNLPRS